MTSPRVVGLQHVVYVFAPTGGPHAAEALDYLQGLWTGCRLKLGMTGQVDGVPVGTELPPTPSVSSGPVLVAAQERPGHDVFQAVVYDESEVRSLAVVLAPADGGDWRELEEMWRDVAGTPPPGLLGEARLYLGLIAASSAKPGARQLGQAVQTGLPEGEEYLRRGDVTPVAGGIRQWEIGGGDDARARRRVVVLAPDGQDAALSAWAWSRGDAAMAPLARYLLHATKVRFQLRVWAGGNRIRSLRRRADTEIGELLALLSMVRKDGATIDVDDLTASAGRLVGLQAEEAGLVTTSTAVREMRRTVEIAVANMAATLRGRVAKTDDSDMFADDRTLADWFCRQLDDDATYLEAARERAHEVGRLADSVVLRLLQNEQEAARLKQDRHNLLQTAIIGAVLMALTAIQSLGYQVPVPAGVKPAIVALLGSLALYLSCKAVRLALPRGRGALTWLTSVSAGWTAAAAVWVGMAALPYQQPGWTAALAGVGFLVGTGVAAWLARRGARAQP